jgi:hypothetical protein
VEESVNRLFHKVPFVKWSQIANRIQKVIYVEVALIQILTAVYLITSIYRLHQILIKEALELQNYTISQLTTGLHISIVLTQTAVFFYYCGY